MVEVSQDQSDGRRRRCSPAPRSASKELLRSDFGADYAAHQLGPAGDPLPKMESTVLAHESLGDNHGVAVDEDRH